MDESSRLTIFFEAPFWVGVFERRTRGRLSAAKVIFGAEPTDAEVYDALLTGYDKLRFSPSVAAVSRMDGHSNPKRIQREAARQSACSGIGTKAQQALKLQQEQQAVARKASRRERREAEKDRQFELRQQKHKEKHRGR